MGRRSGQARKRASLTMVAPGESGSRRPGRRSSAAPRPPGRSITTAHRDRTDRTGLRQDRQDRPPPRPREPMAGPPPRPVQDRAARFVKVKPQITQPLPESARHPGRGRATAGQEAEGATEVDGRSPGGKGPARLVRRTRSVLQGEGRAGQAGGAEEGRGAAEGRRAEADGSPSRGTTCAERVRVGPGPSFSTTFSRPDAAAPGAGRRDRHYRLFSARARISRPVLDHFGGRGRRWPPNPSPRYSF